MTIKTTISKELIETVVHGIMENFPEASAGSALRCSHWRYAELKFAFQDDETGKRYDLDKAKLLAAFPLIFTDKWPKGCTAAPHVHDAETWDNWLCEADAVDFDAFAQLACLGEVIYG